MNTPSEPTTDLPPTITLAKLYEKQGFLKAAADIYRRLVGRDPDNKVLKADLETVEKKLRDGENGVSQPDPRPLLSILEKWHRVVRARKKQLWNETPTAKVLFIQLAVADAGGRESCATEQWEGSYDEKRLAERGDVAVALLSCDNSKVLVERIEEASERYDALIIQHDDDEAFDGEAVRQALSSLTIPIIEVVPANIYAKSRALKPVIAPEATAQLVGFNEKSYAIAVKAAANMISDTKKNRRTNPDEGGHIAHNV